MIRSRTSSAPRLPLAAVALAVSLWQPGSARVTTERAPEAPSTSTLAAKPKPDLAKIHGKIQFVNSFPDYKVKVVDSFPDLKVQKVTSFPDKPGRWQIVTSCPDFKIQLVDSFPDFKIKYVTSFPGVR